MKIVKLGLNLIQKNGNKAAHQKAGFAKRKTPRYLYHITNQENISQILKDGKLKICDSDEIDGVYLFNLQNFLKRWNFNITEDLKNMHMGLGLFLQALKGDSKLFLLKIPTKDIQAKKIKIRSQNRIFDESKEGLRHFQKGDKIQNSKHYLEKKEAIEYIYPEEIPISEQNIIGSAHLDNELLFKTMVKDKQEQKNLFHLVLKDLFANTPEEKNIDFLT